MVFELLGEKEVLIEMMKSIFGSGVIIVTFRWLKKMLLKRKQRLTADLEERVQFRSVVQMMPSIMSAMDDIKKEISPNGGSSLRDSVDRIEWMQVKHNLINIAQLNASDIAYWESDSNGLCVVASNSLCRLLGTSEPDIIGSNWASMIHEDDRGGVMHEWSESIRLKRSFNMAFRFVRHNKSIIHVESKSTPLINANGQMMGVWGRVTEI